MSEPSTKPTSTTTTTTTKKPDEETKEEKKVSPVLTMKNFDMEKFMKEMEKDLKSLTSLCDKENIAMKRLTDLCDTFGHRLRFEPLCFLFVFAFLFYSFLFWFLL
jgi:hypothetical protein